MDAFSRIKNVIESLGGQAAAAALVGVKQPAVSLWCSRGRIPAEHCPKISKATGIALHSLRPDVYPPVPDSLPNDIASVTESEPPEISPQPEKESAHG